MTDRITREQRSRNMQNVHGRNTTPEVYIRKLLFDRGYRYRLHSKLVPGHPDIWLRKYNVAIFIHGCFWHRHNGCKYATTPKTRKEFWLKKFENNIHRDMYVKEELKRLGIKNLIVWECSVKNMRKNPVEEFKILNKIIEFINGEDSYLEL